MIELLELPYSEQNFTSSAARFVHRSFAEIHFNFSFELFKIIKLRNKKKNCKIHLICLVSRYVCDSYTSAAVNLFIHIESNFRSSRLIKVVHEYFFIALMSSVR